MNVLVTGGCRSLGAAITTRLREDGHRVKTLSKTLKEEPDFLCDLSALTAEKALEIITKADCSCLINNAGVTEIDYNERLTADQWDYVHAVNVRAPFLLSQAMLRYHGMDTRKKCTVLNVISMASKTALRCSAAYNSSKAGLAALTKQMAREAADRHPGFVFYGVSPNGIAGTDMIEQARKSLVTIRGMSEDAATKYVAQSPLGRLESMEEVVSTIHYLVNSRPVYLTGTNLEHTGAGQS